MNIKIFLMPILVLAFSQITIAQNLAAEKDSTYVQEVEQQQLPAKVFHAEPLYIDLIRDLGARKGEKEWNLGLGLADHLHFDSYEALVEYEWAPIDRLGLEIELPFTFYSPVNGSLPESIPSHRLNSVKMATQWTFYVSEPHATSMALGYINEVEFSDFKNFGTPLITGNSYNPFLVVARRWGNNFHSLIYTGPVVKQKFGSNRFHTIYDLNTSIHYTITGTKNFIGIEFNKTYDRMDFDMTMRPQLRLGISENTLIGIVVGIPVKRENERFSTFIRLIWEPGH